MFKSSSEDVIKRCSIVMTGGMHGWGTTFFFSIFLVETIYSLGDLVHCSTITSILSFESPPFKFNTNQSIYVAKSGSSIRFLLSHDIVHFYSITWLSEY